MTAYPDLRRRVLWLVIAGLLLISGCVRVPSTGVTPIKSRSMSDLTGFLLSHKPDVDLFRMRGPFLVAVQENREVPLPGGGYVRADLYLAAPAEKAPLIILLHGDGNSMKDHAYQAQHLASWGMHALAVELPNDGPWIANGKTLARLASLVRQQPELIDGRIDANRIILAGHSFGGKAVAVALAEGAPVAGAVLLDPATVEKGLPKILRQVNAPVMVIGADESLGTTTNRGFFFRFIPAKVAEISIRDAVHEDAQYPAQSFGIDLTGREEQQISFASALTSAAFSLSMTGKFDYAWASFDEAIKNNKLFNARRK